jgi:predicted Zn-dependent peptidase
MSRETIHGYWARRYSPESTVIAAAGRIDHEHLVDVVAGAFAAWEGSGIGRTLSAPEPEPRVSVRHRDTEQAHLILGGPSLTRDDDRRYALIIADHVLGGGMSSRLFREIREKRGLAYAVHAFRMPFTDAGANAVYVGTTPSQTAEVLKLVRGEMDRFMESGVTTGELERAKGHVQGSLAISLEDADGRMNRLGRNEITGLDHKSVDEIVAKVDAITPEEVIEVARAAYGGPYVIGATGPFQDADLEEFVR